MVGGHTQLSFVAPSMLTRISEGVRMIFSRTSGLMIVPFVAISYDPKVQGALDGELKKFSIPLAELPRRLRSLPARKDVVAYCRGPYCLMALDAVKALRRRGRRARRLLEGFPEWRAAGLPVQAGAADGMA